jgi:nitric-oxide synthase
LNLDQQVIALDALIAAFPGCKRARVEAAVERLNQRSLEAGEVLIQGDEPGRCAYLLLEGSLQVYGYDQDKRLVPIARLDTPGRLFGEQALLPGRRYRNATVTVLQATRVAEVSLETFQDLLEGDPKTRERLQRQGLSELSERLQRLGVGLEASLVDGDSKQLSAGHRLLEAGVIPSCAYSLVAGQLSLRAPGTTDPVLLLGPGSLVGVEEVQAQRPYPLEAIAETALEVLEVSHERLNQLEGLQALVALPGLGRVSRRRSIRDGELVVVSDYSELPGGALRVMQYPGTRRVEATRNLDDAGQSQTWSSPQGNSQLLIAAEGGRLLGLALEQDAPQLAELMHLLLRDIPLTELQLQGFRANGQLLLEAPEEQLEPSSQMVCACTGTTGRALREAARQCQTLQELQRLSSAGTVCGGCLNRLPLFLNQPAEQRLCTRVVQQLANGSVAIRLLPIDAEPLPDWRVGQNLLVEALLEGRWVGRNYTLTGGDQNHYSLGVKLEPGGVLSNWLATAEPNALVRIGAPQGNVLPKPDDERPLLYLVAGIGVTPALAGVRRLHRQRQLTVGYSYRGEATAAYLKELRTAAQSNQIALHEHDSSLSGRLRPQTWLEKLAPLLASPCEVVVCGPPSFNDCWQERLAPMEGVEVRVESFAGNADGVGNEPGAWRLNPNKLALQRQQDEERFGTCPRPIAVGQSCPLDEARSLLESFRRELEPALNVEKRLEQVLAELKRHGQWQLSHAELRYGARLAWRQAERCVGRLYWQGLELFDRRTLRAAEDIAEALFEHLRFAYNGGDLRPAISVFDQGQEGRPGPRLWNPQLLRYAGYRNASGRQVGDPAQNALTARIMELGWQPSGATFELLPLVLETADEGPQLFPLPTDCQREVMIRHPKYPWLEAMELRWYAVPAVSDMALDVGGNIFRLAPFNGWYLDTEIAARNFSDTNRFNLLPRIAEAMGLERSNDRTLWRDHAQLVLAEAVLYSFAESGVRLSDHHEVGHEFLEFCRQEQKQGREPQAEWSWIVPPMSGSLNVLYQEPFESQALKPAYIPQDPVWGNAPGLNRDHTSKGCPFSS